MNYWLFHSVIRNNSYIKKSKIAINAVLITDFNTDTNFGSRHLFIKSTTLQFLVVIYEAA